MAATIVRATRDARKRETNASAPSSRPQACGTPIGRKDPKDATEALWKRYLATRDKASFDALVGEYRPYVESVAARFSKRLPPSVDIDDLVSAGCFGLMDAIGGFDPSRNTRFQTFGLKRIVGAMNDYLRSQDIAPRLARRREAQVKRARDDFRKKYGRSPTEEELLRLLHADADEARAIVDGAEIPCMSSLTAPSDDGDAGQTMEAAVSVAVERNVAGSGPAPSGLFDRDVQKWLGRSLSRSERLIIWLYYFESLTMKEIGQVLGICEGRVSQIHALLLERLRARLTREQDAE
jgi:RNA polymerase sigma factor for flagellar operon FliA